MLTGRSLQGHLLCFKSTDSAPLVLVLLQNSCSVSGKSFRILPLKQLQCICNCNNATEPTRLLSWVLGALCCSRASPPASHRRLFGSEKPISSYNSPKPLKNSPDSNRRSARQANNSPDTSPKGSQAPGLCSLPTGKGRQGRDVAPCFAQTRGKGKLERPDLLLSWQRRSHSSGCSRQAASRLETVSRSIETSKKPQENAEPLPIAGAGQSNSQSINGAENTGRV